MQGRLEVIAGPMFASKSEELLRRMRRAQIAGHTCAIIKPEVDSRYDKNYVISHAGAKMEAMTARNSIDIRTVAFPYRVIGIDEAQFFDEGLPSVLMHLSKQRIVIVSGLDMTYRREPFGSMPILLAIADRVDKLSAICHKCGSEMAVYTQRLLDGEPAPLTGPTVQIGGLETYEARCRECWGLT